jgi:hypothetical protein
MRPVAKRHRTAHVPRNRPRNASRADAASSAAWCGVAGGSSQLHWWHSCLQDACTRGRRVSAAAAEPAAAAACCPTKPAAAAAAAGTEWQPTASAARSKPCRHTPEWQGLAANARSAASRWSAVPPLLPLHLLALLALTACRRRRGSAWVPAALAGATPPAGSSTPQVAARSCCQALCACWPCCCGQPRPGAGPAAGCCRLPLRQQSLCQRGARQGEAKGRAGWRRPACKSKGAAVAQGKGGCNSSS